MGQDPGKIETMYDVVAADYADRFRDEHAHKPMDRELLRRFARAVGEGRPVWDLGCGPGQTTRWLHDRGLAIAGLDLSEEMLRQARASHPGIVFRKGDLLALSFEDGSVAGAVAFYAIVHLDLGQVEQAFREVFRVLRPGGLFLATFHVGDEALQIDEFLGHAVDIEFRFFETASIEASLRKAGFAAVEILEREPYPVVEYESRRAYTFATK